MATFFVNRHSLIFFLMSKRFPEFFPCLFSVLSINFQKLNYSMKLSDPVDFMFAKYIWNQKQCSTSQICALLAVLVSRQFVDMSRIRIEGLLAAFPKLVGTGKQHTYVETENVRYVYQPIEALYLLLVTNKQSNILEDLETLRLLSKLVSL